MTINSKTQWAQSLALCAAVMFAGIGSADDTDIYTQSSDSASSAPLVMFSLDFRSNLGSTICTSGSVATTWTDPDLSDDSVPNSDFDCPAAAFLARTADTKDDIETLVDDGRKLDFFGVIRGAMKIVLNDVSGVKVGLMMNHHNINNCEGPSNADTEGCSNGGYIPIGFRLLQDNDANGNKAYIYSVLDTLDELSRGVYVEGAETDTDSDGVGDSTDNCPNTSNPGQVDTDGDGDGDACDSDDDGDGVADASDNCPTTANADQADTNGNGVGDACENDSDGDGVADGDDNCPNTANADQADDDGDGIGDLCDDGDGDGVLDINDNCPSTPNADQADSDGDGTGDACEEADPDSDGDGFPDSVDDCPNDPEDGKGPDKTDGCPKGGVVVGTVEDGGTGKAASPNQDHSYQGKELFFEFFRYLTGQNIYNAHNGWDDYLKDSAELNLPDDASPLQWDEDIEQQDADNASVIRYISPLQSGACSRVFTINIMFQVSQQDADSDSAILASKSDGGMEGITLDSSEEFADVIGYMNDVDLADGTYGKAPDLAGDQNVTSYFIVDETKINTKTTSYAQAGGTDNPLALSEDPEELVQILTDIFREILSVSTTFVAASIPVNVFNRAETEDELFLALFEANTNDYWNGNVKKLKIQSSDGGRSIVDALGNDAIGADGRINFSALTPWTLQDDGDGSNDYLPAGYNVGDIPQGNDAEIIEGRDGRHVNRGGSGQRIPGFLPDGDVIGENNTAGDRKVFTNSGGSLVDLAVNTGWTSGDGGIIQSIIDELNAQNDPDALGNQYCENGYIVGGSPNLDAEDDCIAEANNLIRYMRGLDIDDADADGNNEDARPWIFGDPLHSKPFPLNYGAYDDSVAGQYSDDTPAIYLAVAGNDGGIRLLRNTLPDGTESGEELWTFIPDDTLETQLALEENSVMADGVHPYGVDGSPVPVFVRADSGSSTVDAASDTVSMVVGQRRGGKHYYAVEITDPNNPSLDWTIEPSGDFANLGYTFSTPQNAVVNYGSGDVRALIFAGGYDTNKDAHSTGTDDSVGNSLFIVNADTGVLIKELTAANNSSFVDSAPSDVTVADTNADGVSDRVIFGDTGGNVWRADLHGTLAQWKISHLAQLGRHGTSDTEDRRFFHAPDLVRFRDDTGDYDAIVITSGDRANPLDLGLADEVENYAFMIKDRNTAPGSGAPLDSGSPLDLEDLADITDNCIGEGTCASAPDLTNGWRMELTATGEKGLAVPFTFGGVIFFTTFVPADNSSGTQCGPAEGGGRLYAVNIEDGTPAYDYNESADDETDRYEELDSGGIPAEVVFVPPDQILKPDLSFEDLNAANRFRTFWQFLEQ